jgi:hypothetical protein
MTTASRNSSRREGKTKDFVADDEFIDVVLLVVIIGEGR